MVFEIAAPGTRWHSGTYESAAFLSVAADSVAAAVGRELLSGVEMGLGPWRAIGLRLESGVLVELIEHRDAPIRGVEVRVDSAADLDAALAAVLAILKVGEDVVLWRNPLSPSTRRTLHARGEQDPGGSDETWQKGQ